MSHASERDVIMLSEPLERAAIPSPFFPTTSWAYGELKTFDDDLLKAQDKMRHKEKRGSDSDDDEQQHEQKRHKPKHHQWYEHDGAKQWWQEESGKKPPGYRLTTHGVFMTEVQWDQSLARVSSSSSRPKKMPTIISPAHASDDTAIHKSMPSRMAWCNMQCTSHPRPEGFIMWAAADLTHA